MATPIEVLINKEERMLLALKNNLKYQTNQAWIAANYKGQPTESEPIRQIQAEITARRKALKELYNQI
jgi:hypothetical protein